MERTVEDIVLDIRGQICPACLLITLSELNNNKERLKGAKARMIVKTDHRDATRTIPGAAFAMGYSVSVVQKDRHYEITLEHEK
ncbi:MAG: sulfurtransferase TusA family protein [Nitrospiraceae bacterium]|nr:sulfurtransferase TusA family protein [Nitrospiraceae bacterium]MDA8169080.1 sulfurtransferase TusA family protein [Nitrospiraceae bacterium]